MSAVKTQADVTVLQNLIKQLFAAYPSAKVSPEMVIVYCEDLATLDLTILKEALTNLRRTSVYLPNVADIFEESDRVGRKRLEQAESSNRKALEASTITVPETEVSRMLFAIQHNIAKRQEKEEKIRAKQKQARSVGDQQQLDALAVELQEIREDHQVIADMITTEFAEGKPISYLKETGILSTTSKSNGFQSVGSFPVTAQSLRGVR